MTKGSSFRRGDAKFGHFQLTVPSGRTARVSCRRLDTQRDGTQYLLSLAELPVGKSGFKIGDEDLDGGVARMKGLEKLGRGESAKNRDLKVCTGEGWEDEGRCKGDAESDREKGREHRRQANYS